LYQVNDHNKNHVHVDYKVNNKAIKMTPLHAGLLISVILCVDNVQELVNNHESSYYDDLGVL